MIDGRRLFELGGRHIDDGYGVPIIGVQARSRDHFRISQLKLAEGQPKNPACRRLTIFGRKGLGAISRRFLPPIVPILAKFGQKLSRIGANGVMVYRMGVPC